MAEQSSQWAVVVEHALGSRLHAGERLLRSLPRLFPGFIRSVDLAVRGRPRLLMALVRFSGTLSAENEVRLLFWAHRSRAEVQDLERLGKRDRAHFLARFASSEHRAQAVAPDALAATLLQLLKEAQVRGDTPIPDTDQPTLALKVGTRDDGCTWEAESQRLFVASALMPPLGERMELLLRVQTLDFNARGTVSQVFAPGRHPEGAAGFHLQLMSPSPRLLEALAACAPTQVPDTGVPQPAEAGRRAPSRRMASPPPPRPGPPPRAAATDPAPVERPPPQEPPAGPEQRASPRFRLHAPVQIVRVSPEPVPEFRMDYASGQAFANEWIDNLSLGGAFVRTTQPLPMFASLKLDIHLPGRVLPPVPAKVVRVLPQGMGVQFELTPPIRAELEEALEQLASRPRRALVALADAGTRDRVREALLTRGFEVRAVVDANKAIGVLLEDAPWLDLLIIDAAMHPTSGRSLVRMVREEGGEQDLAIAVQVPAGSAQAWADSGRGAGLDVIAEEGVAPELFASRVEEAISRRQLNPQPAPVVLAAPRAPTRTRLVMRYETPEALRAAAEVLRVGGAFVFSSDPHEVGQGVELAIELPGGGTLLTRAEVVSVEAAGVGVAFRLEGQALAALEAALTEVGAAAAQRREDASARSTVPDVPGGGDDAATSPTQPPTSPPDGEAEEGEPWKAADPAGPPTDREAPGGGSTSMRLEGALRPPPPPTPTLPPVFQTLLEEEPSNMHGPRVGPFSLLSMLGQGGVAQVHFARALSGPLKGRHVALKRLLPHAARDARFVELFAGEADVTRMLEHPNLVRTLSVGLDAELPWMAMEVVDGTDLGQLLALARKSGAPFPVGVAVGVVHTLLGALDYVHGAVGLSGEPLHLVHSDISPANVFVTRQGVVKLGDFGVARARGVQMDVAGKAHYLSPDALAGRLEPGVDLWATAVLLYELLTLQRPFDGADTEAVLTAIRKRRYVRIRRLRPDVPADLERLLDRAFSPRARHQFASAAEMADALAPWCGSESAMQRLIAEQARSLLERTQPVP
ncbi:MAG TPA: protein kinase [Myxococcaceae bacterium]|nr:protein kinase [Myxococcaceae bacterium]